MIKFSKGLKAGMNSFLVSAPKYLNEFSPARIGTATWDIVSELLKAPAVVAGDYIMGIQMESGMRVFSAHLSNPSTASTVLVGDLVFIPESADAEIVLKTGLTNSGFSEFASFEAPCPGILAIKVTTAPVGTGVVKLVAELY